MEVTDGVAARKKRIFLLPVLDTGCFCCDLDVCCKVQGWFAAIGSGAAVILHLADLTTSREELHMTEKGDLIIETVDDPWALDVANVILIIAHLALLVCAILFLRGIREKRPELMIHYIRAQMVFVVLGLIYSIVKAVESGSVFAFIFVLLIYCGLQYYMLICSSSLHFKMCYFAESIELPVTSYPPPGYAPPNATGYPLPPAVGGGGAGYPSSTGYAPPAYPPAGYAAVPAATGAPSESPYPTKPLDGSSPTLV